MIIKKCKNYNCDYYNKYVSSKCGINPDGDLEGCDCRNDDPSKIEIKGNGVEKRRNNAKG